MTSSASPDGEALDGGQAAQAGKASARPACAPPSSAGSARWAPPSCGDARPPDGAAAPRGAACAPGSESRPGAATSPDAPCAPGGEPSYGAPRRFDPAFAAAPPAGAPALDAVHPAIPLAFFAAALGLTMGAFQPVLIATSLMGALACGALLRGGRAVARDLRWQLPLLVIVTLVNPVFAARGATELFRVGSFAFYGESLAYGAAMGGLLLATIAWFANAAAVLSADRVMTALGGRAPALALMLSMTLRLVPRFSRHGRAVADAQAACSRVAPAGKRQTIAAAVRQMSVLVGWSMEDCLETADSMRARGWASGARRTAYRRQRFRARDAVFMAVVLGLGALCVAVAVAAVGQFRFYPTLTPLAPWWGYVPYALFFFLPCVLIGGERLRWMR